MTDQPKFKVIFRMAPVPGREGAGSILKNEFVLGVEEGECRGRSYDFVLQDGTVVTIDIEPTVPLPVEAWQDAADLP